MKNSWKFEGTHFRLVFFIGLLSGIVLLLFSNEALEYTSTDESCSACHVHPHATSSWKLSAHYGNTSGVVVHCVDCHLPPDGVRHYTEKARTGLKDIYGFLFKDKSKIDWEAKSSIEHAKKITYNESCQHCHQNLFQLDLSQKGINAHRDFLQNPEDKTCVQCHLEVGHYDPDAFFEAVKGLEHEPENGLRCPVCYRLRLASTAEYAARNLFDCIASTLTLGPQKKATVINPIGIEAAQSAGVDFLEGDWKKKDGFKRSLELSHEMGMYRQHYCGCVFSIRK